MQKTKWSTHEWEQKQNANTAPKATNNDEHNEKYTIKNKANT